jgi:energy-converting hydrogenase B subunit D
MSAVQTVVLLFVAVGGTAVVLTREPSRQALVASFYGLLLTLMFVVFQAPDVALSELAVGTAAVPLMILLAVSKAKTLEKQNPSGNTDQ